jgi:hypothetical protein
MQRSDWKNTSAQHESYLETNIQITNKMHLNVHDVFYSLYLHQHVSAVIAAIFRLMLLLQKHNCTNAVSCVAVTP